MTLPNISNCGNINPPKNNTASQGADCALVYRIKSLLESGSDRTAELACKVGVVGSFLDSLRSDANAYGAGEETDDGENQTDDGENQTGGGN